MEAEGTGNGAVCWRADGQLLVKTDLQIAFNRCAFSRCLLFTKKCATGSLCGFANTQEDG